MILKLSLSPFFSCLPRIFFCLFFSNFLLTLSLLPRLCLLSLLFLLFHLFLKLSYRLLCRQASISSPYCFSSSSPFSSSLLPLTLLPPRLSLFSLPFLLVFLPAFLLLRVASFSPCHVRSDVYRRVKFLLVRRNMNFISLYLPPRLLWLISELCFSSFMFLDLLPLSLS